jgi:hypothetical protein
MEREREREGWYTATVLTTFILIYKVYFDTATHFPQVLTGDEWRSRLGTGGKRGACQYLYCCTSKARKLST